MSAKPHHSLPTLPWRCGAHTLDCGPRPLLMGVLNVTPDSFSDGGRFLDPGRALEQARRLADEGADLIDIGGESTRPGSRGVSVEEECGRVLPVLEALRADCPLPISIDTSKAEVARRALEAGADIVNDVSGLRADPTMPALAAESGCGLVVMHMQGDPATMQQRPHYEDAPAEIEAFFRERLETLAAAGIDPARVCLDPGIGFGKRLEDNLALIAGAGRLRRLGAPVLLGMSRKSFLEKISPGLATDERLEGSLAAAVLGHLAGADILRVHDVAATRRALAPAAALVPLLRAALREAP